MQKKTTSRKQQAEPQLDPGLCGTCTKAKIIRSDRGSVFYRCTLSETNPVFPKYPRLPVLSCSGWNRAEPEAG